MYGNKKNICLLIVLIILVNIMPNIKYTANATGDLVFSNPIFTREADGESEMDVKVLKSGVNIFSLDVNNLGAPTAITLILSLYKNNSLEKTVLSTRTINSTYTLQSGIIVPETNGEKYILKAFVLDNMQSLMPLSATYFIETGDGEEEESVFGKFDSKFDKKLMDWTASLYDAETGGFYYSISARNNEGFAPDIETTLQMVNIWVYMGLIPSGNPTDSEMPPIIKERLVKFMQERQDPSDGYFYDKQFGKNVSDSKKERNLSQAVSILTRFGAKPLYPTPTERIAPKTKTMSADPRFTSREAFENWMRSLPWETYPYSAGNSMSSASSLIKAAGFLSVAQEFLMSIQNTQTGLWGEGLNYESLNAAMKVAGLFDTSCPYPYLDRMLESLIYVVKNCEATTTAMLWNPLALVTSARNSYGRFTPEQKQMFDESLLEMLDIMAEGLDKFRQPDNGYSWSPNGSSITSQGARVSLGTAEGDVNGTTLAMLLRRDAYLLAGHSPRVLWYWDRAEYWDKLLNASPIVKNDLSKGLSFNFDNMTLNGKPNEWKLTTEVGSVNVQKDPKNSSNQALKISTKSSGVTFATLPFSSVNNISKLKFTGRFMVENSNNGAFFYNKIGDALQWCFVGNGDSFNLTHRQSEVGVGSVILALDYGKWYDIKIEYEPKGLTNTKVRFYINNSLKLESNRYMGINNNKGPVKNIDNISFNSFIAGTGNVYLDDVSIIVTK